MTLSTMGARVIGSLVEKALTTPQQYPLTITSLVTACNQTSNRDPVVSFDEHAVMRTLNELKEQRLVRFVLPSHGRTAVRYRHVIDEVMGLDVRRCALLAVLLLRGPQTVGELRSRTDRMAEFDGLDDLERELESMTLLTDPLALRLGRRPGQKEERWICPFLTAGSESDPAVELADAGVNWTTTTAEPDAAHTPHSRADQDLDLREEVAVLRSELGELRRDLDELRASLGE